MIGRFKRMYDTGADDIPDVSGAQAAATAAEATVLQTQKRAKMDFDMLQQQTALYVLAERQWKMSDTRYVNAPNHVCDPDVCVMQHVPVVVYRKENATGFRDMFDYDSTGESAIADVHVCIPELCMHLQPGHSCPQEPLCRQARCAHLPRLCAKTPHLFHRDVRCGRGLCAHVAPKAICREPGRCPHRHSYVPSEIRELRDFWVCRGTGCAHICGDGCTQRKIVSAREMHVICALTRTIVRSTLLNPDSWKLENRLVLTDDRRRLPAGESEQRVIDDMVATGLILGAAGPPSLAAARHAQTGGGSRGSRSGGGGLRQLQQQRRIDIPPWERHEDVVANINIAKQIFQELMFSERRQSLEIEAVISGRQLLFKETHKALRHKKMPEEVSEGLRRFEAMYKQGLAAEQADGSADEDGCAYTLNAYSTPTKVVNGVTTFAVHSRRSAYFAHVPVMPQLVPAAQRVLDAIKEKHMATATTAEILTNIPLQKVRAAAVADLQTRSQRLLAAVVDAHRAQTASAASEAPALLPEWDSAEWQQTAADITNCVAQVVVKIWMNINQHCLDWHGTRTELNFQRIVLPLMYMLKANFTVRAQCISGPETGERLPQIVVVPKVAFATLLPFEGTICNFNIDALCNPSSKTITSIQTMIQKLFWTAASNGKAALLRVRLEDVGSFVPTAVQPATRE